MDIEDIVAAIRNSRVRIADHADEEAVDDVLTFDEIYFSAMHGEIIKEYPNNKPYPSCLTWVCRRTNPQYLGLQFKQWVGGFDYCLSSGSCAVDGLESEGEEMTPFEKCPVCGGALESNQVEKLLRGGGNTVSLKVTAEICLHCGERLYTEDVVRSFEEIRAKLQKQEFAHLKTGWSVFYC